MAKVNSGSSGCRAVVMAGQFWTRPPGLRQQRSAQHQRRLASVNQHMRASSAAGHGGKNSAWSQQELPNYAWSNRTLIYRDVKAFLNEIGGDPREARYWLTYFQRAGSFPAFAVLEVRVLRPEWGWWYTGQLFEQCCRATLVNVAVNGLPGETQGLRLI